MENANNMIWKSSNNMKIDDSSAHKIYSTMKRLTFLLLPLPRKHDKFITQAIRVAFDMKCST
jgi:hypothetical protein